MNDVAGISPVIAPLGAAGAEGVPGLRARRHRRALRQGLAVARVPRAAVRLSADPGDAVHPRRRRPRLHPPAPARRAKSQDAARLPPRLGEPSLQLQDADREGRLPSVGALDPHARLLDLQLHVLLSVQRRVARMGELPHQGGGDLVVPVRPCAEAKLCGLGDRRFVLARLEGRREASRRGSRQPDLEQGCALDRKGTGSKAAQTRGRGFRAPRRDARRAPAR